MAEIIKTYVQDMPAVRFIGKQYTQSDMQNGSFATQWDKWFQTGLFGRLETALKGRLPDLGGDEDAYIGLETMTPDGKFAYMIGMLAEANTSAPDDFIAYDLPAAAVKVAWVRGRADNGEVYGQEGACIKALEAAGLPVAPRNGEWLCLERYVCPRFTCPDAEGRVVLDICFY